MVFPTLALADGGEEDAVAPVPALEQGVSRSAAQAPQAGRRTRDLGMASPCDETDSRPEKRPHRKDCLLCLVNILRIAGGRVRVGWRGQLPSEPHYLLRWKTPSRTI